MPPALIDLVRGRVSKGFDRPVGSRGQFQGPCPICGGTDRFCVFPDQEPKADIAIRAGAWGGYWCNQCSVAGDYVQWLVEVEGWDWTKIFEFLGVEGEGAGQGNLPPVRRVPPGPRIGRELDELEEIQPPPEKWREHAEKFVAVCTGRLEENADLVKWLERRGVPLAVAKEHRLGWHPGEEQRNGPPCAYRNRKGWGLEPQLNQNGRPKSIWLPRGLVIPNYRNGDLFAVRIRRPNKDGSPDEDKYKLVAGSVAKVSMISPGARNYVVIESALDGLAVMAAKVEGVGMCSMGSLSAYPDKKAAAHIARADTILQALDFEPQGKGEKHGNKFRHWWQARFPQCRRAPMPIGKDPGEFVEQAGLAGLKAWLESQLPSSRLAALAPRKKIEKAPGPVQDGVRLPEPVQRLYGLLASCSGSLMVAPSGNVVSMAVPDDLLFEVRGLVHVSIANKWLREIGGDSTSVFRVDRSNFMKPLGGGR